MHRLRYALSTLQLRPAAAFRPSATCDSAGELSDLRPSTRCSFAHVYTSGESHDAYRHNSTASTLVNELERRAPWADASLTDRIAELRAVGRIGTYHRGEIRLHSDGRRSTWKCVASRRFSAVVC